MDGTPEIIIGGDGNDVLANTPTSTPSTGEVNEEVSGLGGDDVLTLTAPSPGQIHAYGHGGNDVLDLGFVGIDERSDGHHVYGDGVRDEGPKGRDVFNFTDLDQVNDVVVGRIDDFDPQSDRIQIEGVDLDFQNLPSNVRTVAYKGEHNDPDIDPQQWLLIDTGGGYVFYALDGARIDPSREGENRPTTHEQHFVKLQEVDDFDAFFAGLPDIDFVDQKNHVPAGLEPDGGEIVNDKDYVIEESREVVDGTSEGDLIAAGLNGDVVEAGGGDDRVWGGSGDDTVRGGDGDDTLEGNAGSDVLTGGAGRDVFAYAPGDGSDVITDFTPGTDRIDLSATGLPGFEALDFRISISGDDVVLNVDTDSADGADDTLTLEGLADRAALSAGDFVFAEGDAPTDGGDEAPEPEPTPEPVSEPAPEPEPTAEPEPEPEAPSGDVREFAFDADAGGQLVIEGFDVDTGGERTYDTVELTFEGRTTQLRDGEDLLALMLELETDRARRPESDAVVSPDADVVLRFGADAALTLEGAAAEFTTAQLDGARVDYESVV